MADEDFNEYKEKTFEELDKEVEQAVKEDRNRKIRQFIIGLIIAIFIFPDAFLYWFRFATPHRAKYKTEEIIDVSKAPIQTYIYDDENNDRFITYHTLENKGTFQLKKMAKYSISGKVVAKNYFFISNYIPKHNRPFNSMALFDIGLVWGDMADKDILSYYKFVSAQSAVARALYPRLKRNVRCAPLSWAEAKSLFSHTHVIPANPTIQYALLYTHKNQPVKLEGYLVDIHYADGKINETSLSRNDTNSTARGGGACEIMYVERVQVGNRVYE